MAKPAPHTRFLTLPPSPMSNPHWFWSCDGRSYACSHHPAFNGLLVPMANVGHSCPGTHGLNGHRKSKRHETVWRAVASRKGSWNYKWRNLATVPEILPGAARLNDKRSAAGRICASNASSCAYASADTIGFTVPVAAASSSARWKRRVERRRICVGAGSSVSLSRIDCRLGQRAFAHLPFPWNTRLRPHEERGLYVRGGGSDFR
jgi:hypothetical protein